MASPNWNATKQRLWELGVVGGEGESTYTRLEEETGLTRQQLQMTIDGRRHTPTIQMAITEVARKAAHTAGQPAPSLVDLFGEESFHRRGARGLARLAENLDLAIADGMLAEGTALSGRSDREDAA